MSSRCSSADQVLVVPAGNPATGSTLSQTHSTGTAVSSCSTMLRRWSASVTATQWMSLASSSGAKAEPTTSRTRGSEIWCSNDVQSTGPGSPRSSSRPPVAVYQRANSAAVLDFPAPAKACSSTIRCRSKARSSASSVSSRPKNPTSGAAGTAPRPDGARPGADTQDWLLGRREQGQRQRLVDRRHHPVLQRDGLGPDQAGRVGVERLAGQGRRTAEAAAGEQCGVEVGDELGRGDDVDVVAHRHDARDARVGDLRGERAVGPDPVVDGLPGWRVGPSDWPVPRHRRSGRR